MLVLGFLVGLGLAKRCDILFHSGDKWRLQILVPLEIFSDSLGI